jgi:hypothetical protein
MTDIVNTLKRLQELQTEMDSLSQTLREADQPAPPPADQSGQGQQAQGTAQATQQQQAGGAEVDQIVAAIEAAVQKALEPISTKIDEISKNMGQQSGGNNGEQKPQEGSSNNGNAEKSNDNPSQQSTNPNPSSSDNSGGGSSGNSSGGTSGGNNENKQQESVFKDIFNKTKLN